MKDTNSTTPRRRSPEWVMKAVVITAELVAAILSLITAILARR